MRGSIDESNVLEGWGGGGGGGGGEGERRCGDLTHSTAGVTSSVSKTLPLLTRC